MSRPRGKPAYKKKTIGPLTFVTTRLAEQKIKAAERRTGKSRSDVITHCVMKEADNITRDMFNILIEAAS